MPGLRPLNAWQHLKRAKIGAPVILGPYFTQLIDLQTKARIVGGLEI